MRVRPCRGVLSAAALPGQICGALPERGFAGRCARQRAAPSDKRAGRLR